MEARGSGGSGAASLAARWWLFPPVVEAVRVEVQNRWDGENGESE
jgi:hypothetical protein